jgi:hypothetical protein
MMNTNILQDIGIALLIGIVGYALVVIAMCF